MNIAFFFMRSVFCFAHQAWLRQLVLCIRQYNGNISAFFVKIALFLYFHSLLKHLKMIDTKYLLCIKEWSVGNVTRGHSNLVEKVSVETQHRVILSILFHLFIDEIMEK